MILSTQSPFTVDVTSANQIGGATQMLLVVVFVLAAVALVVILTARRQSAKERENRMKLLEEALRNPNLDPQAQRELVRSLRTPQGRAPFVVGWFGLFVGIAWLCTEPRGDECTIAIVLTALSGACVTLPLALRELEARKA